MSIGAICGRFTVAVIPAAKNAIAIVPPFHTMARAGSPE